MLKPAGTFSFAVGSLSGVAAIGGGATGASLAAASLPAGRPINGDPGGSAGAAPAAGGVAGCCAAAPSVKALRKAPASNRLRGAEEWVVMGVLPWRKPALYARHIRAPTPVAFRAAISNIFPSKRNRKHASQRPRPPNGLRDADRRHRASVLGN